MSSNPDEWRGRADATGDVGEAIDDLLESAKNEVQQAIGRGVAFTQAADKIGKLVAHVKKDRDEGKLGLEQASEIVKWIVRAQEICNNMKGQTKAREVACFGKVEALEQAVKVTQKHHVTAASRFRQLTADPEPSEETEGEAIERRGGRRAGEHPGRSALDARRDESDAESEPELPPEPSRKSLAERREEAAELKAKEEADAKAKEEEAGTKANTAAVKKRRRRKLGSKKAAKKAPIKKTTKKVTSKRGTAKT